jgi:hypothetical protein
MPTRFRGSEVQRFRGSEVQRFRGSEVQIQRFRFRGSEAYFALNSVFHLKGKIESKQPQRCFNCSLRFNGFKGSKFQGHPTLNL